MLVLDSPTQNQSIIRVTASVDSNIAKAIVNINGYQIDLNQDPNDKTRWTGSAIISKDEKEKIFATIIPPTISIRDVNGQEISQDIDLEGINPIQPSLLSQYSFIRSHQSSFLAPLFEISSIYFKFLLAFLVIALIFNIIIEVKKQHPHVIASALGLIGILAVLIIY
jgi:hypothetical protein